MDFFINKYENKSIDLKNYNDCKHLNIYYCNLKKQEICKVCGIVLKEDIISNKNDYVDGEYNNVNTISSLLPNMSMNTFISGNKYTSLQKLHLWSKVSSFERSLYEVFKKIDNIMYDIFNKKIVEDTKRIYHKLYNNDDDVKKILTRGDIRLGLISACSYFSLFNNHIPHEPFEIAKLYKIDLKIVKKGIREFYKINLNRNNKIIINNINYNDYFIRYSSILDIPIKFNRILFIVFNRIKKLNLIKNNNTIVIIFGILYLVILKFKINVSKQKLLTISNISEITLNKIFSLFNIYSDLLFLDID